MEAKKWKENLLEQWEIICDMMKFRRDWDGYGGEPMHPQSYQASVEFFNRLKFEIRDRDIDTFFDFCPQSDGLVGFTWEIGTNEILGTFTEKREVEYSIICKGNYDAEESFENVSLDDFIEDMIQLMEGK